MTDFCYLWFLHWCTLDALYAPWVESALSAMSASPNFVKPWLPKTQQPPILLKNASLIDPVDGRVGTFG